MVHLITIVLITSNIMASEGSFRSCCNPCSSHRRSSFETRPVSPEYNRDYYTPPDQITWRSTTDQEQKELKSLRDEAILTKGKMHKPVCIGDGGMPYTSLRYHQRRRSSSATTTLSDSGSDSSDGMDVDRPDLRSLPGLRSAEREVGGGVGRPNTLCDRLRLSLAGVSTQSKWVWTFPRQELQRQLSFEDDEQPGLRHRTQVVDTRKKTYVLQPHS